MWRGRLPRHILEVAHESYVQRDESHLHRDTESDLINCGLGTNPMGMSPAAREKLSEASSWDLCSYPPPLSVKLQKAIVGYLGGSGISESNIVLGHGSIDVIVMLIRLLLPPGSLLSGVSPQFTDTPLQAMLSSVRYQPVVLNPPLYEAGLDVWERAARHRPHVLYIDRPHNPTGQVLPLEDLRLLAEACMDRGCWVIVDEAYGDYLPVEESAVSLDLPNCIVTRSFSKAWGLAGLRAGYGVIRDSELLEIFGRLQPPFAVSTAAIEAAVAALSDSQFLEATRSYVAGAKQAMTDALGKINGLELAKTDPATPIFLARLRKGNLYEALATAGIGSEPGTGYLNLDDMAVRLRVPAPAELDTAIQRIKRLA